MKKMGIKQYTKKQWFFLIIYCGLNVLGAFSATFRNPFFPIVADQKGATSSQYGIVFGVFSLMVCFSSPLYGKMIPHYGATFICNLGVFMLSCTHFIFGFLDMVNSTKTFIGLATALRIVEGLGYGAFRCASLCIVVKEFPNDVDGAFAIFQSFFTVGVILGPITGGALFELGGFTLPFLVISTLLICFFLILLCIPKNVFKQEYVTETSKLRYYDILKLPTIILAISANIGSYMNLGFILSFLEPHVLPLNLTPSEMGFLYVSNAAAYCISAQVWGKLCESYVNPHYVWSFGALLIIIGLILLGPASYLPFQMNIYTCIIALVIHGFGESAEVVAAFSGMNKAVIESGISVDIHSHGLISTIFTTSLAFALFIGPTIGGFLYEFIGFAWTCHVYVLFHAILILASIIYMIFFKGIGIPRTEFEIIHKKRGENSYETLK